MPAQAVVVKDEAVAVVKDEVVVKAEAAVDRPIEVVAVVQAEEEDEESRQNLRKNKVSCQLDHRIAFLFWRF